jgi:hypothetical protein
MEKKEILNELLQNLEKKNFVVYIYTPSIPDNVYSMVVEEIYNVCYFLNNNGFDSKLITGDDETEDSYKIPQFLPTHLQELPHVSPKKETLTIKPEDFIIVPDFFVNVMHQISDYNLPCERIVLFQSQSYMLDSLPPNMSWVNWGFTNVITTTPELKEFLERNSRFNYNIQQYNIGIPDYFKPKTIKKPIIMYYSRDEKPLKKVTKLFFMKYPELGWVLFERVAGEEPYILREDLANRLGEAPVLLWLDSEAGFGTLPLEAMKSGAVVVGLLPEIDKDYVKHNDTAIWSSSYEIIAEQLGIVIKEWLVDNIPDVVYENMKNISSKYTTDEHEKSLVEAFNNILRNKIEKTQNIIKNEK